MKRAFITILCMLSVATAKAQNNTDPDKVVIVEDGDPIPQYSRYITEIDAGGNCDYNTALQIAKRKTANKGGNIFVVYGSRNGHGGKEGGSMIRGDVYYCQDIEPFLKYMQGKDTVTSKLISDTAQYAYVYFYQLPNKEGMVRDFKLTMNHVAYTIPNDKSFRIKIAKQGSYVLFQENNRKYVERILNIQFGKVYFVKCEISSSGLGRYYNISIVPSNTGYSELQEVGLN